MDEKRQAALNAKKVRYDPGYPCVNGHWAERNAKNNQCVDCVYERHWRRKLKEKARMDALFGPGRYNPRHGARVGSAEDRAARRRKELRTAAKRGQMLVRMEVLTHPLDKEAVDAYATALRLQREAPVESADRRLQRIRQALQERYGLYNSRIDADGSIIVTGPNPPEGAYLSSRGWWLLGNIQTWEP